MQDSTRRVVVRDGDIVNDLLYADMEQMRALSKLCDSLSEQKSNVTGDVVMLAEVPDVVLEKYCNERGVLWSELMRSREMQTEFINSEYAAPFRVWGRSNNLKF